jgi:hypothetical protein
VQIKERTPRPCSASAPALLADEWEQWRGPRVAGLAAQSCGAGMEEGEGGLSATVLLLQRAAAEQRTPQFPKTEDLGR